VAKKPSTIKIEQVRSPIGRPARQHQTLQGLGLRRIRHVVERADTPAVRGMVARIPHLVRIVEE
jgi:large subunit ribosomal protein L30